MVEEQDEPLGRLARALTGAPGPAADLLGEVADLARTHRGAGEEVEAGPDDWPLSEPHLGDPGRQALLVRRFLRRNRRSRAGSPDPAPGAGVEPDDLETRLARVEPLGRVAVLLRHGHGLPLAELARVTERSPAAVTRALVAAETALAAEPYEVEQLLWRAEPPDPGAVAAAERRSRVRRRRHRTRLVLAGALAAALVAAATVLPGVLHPGPYARAHGEWTFGVHLASEQDFRLDGHQLGPGTEVLSIGPVAQSDASCTVTVTTTTTPGQPPEGRHVRLGDRDARFVEPAGDELWWALGPLSSTLVECEGARTGTAEPMMLSLADQLRFAAQPLRVPFDLRGLPATEEVTTYVDYAGSAGVLVAPRGEGEESPSAVFVGLVGKGQAGATSGQRLDVNGHPGRMADDVNETTVCWPVGDRTVCASMLNQYAGNSRGRTGRTGRVLTTARQVRLAPDLDDPATWFDARDAFPS